MPLFRYNLYGCFRLQSVLKGVRSVHQWYSDAFSIPLFNPTYKCMYMYLGKKSYSFSRIFSSNRFNLADSFSSKGIVSSKRGIMFSDASCNSAIPFGVIVTTVSRLSISDVDLSTNFLRCSRSIIRGTLELFSIILHPISFTHISSGCLPFKMRNTLYCSCVSPYGFRPLLTSVLSHQAVYITFNPAFCNWLLK